MTRTQKLLRHVSRDGRGVEIGPSHSPVAPRRDGFNVITIDTLDREGLQKKYRAHNVDLERIEDVSYVWRGEPYARLIKEPLDFDWIIASHVIEHTPDLIGFLNDCADVLAPNGILSLAIPDKRYCFDHFRPLSSLGAIIDRHVSKPATHTVGSIVEFMLNAVSRDGKISWASSEAGAYRFLCTPAEIQAHLEAGLEGPLDTDVHAWCFTPNSFRLIIRDLHALGLTRLTELEFLPTEGSEFFMTLSKRETSPPLERLPLLQEIERELSA